MAGEIEQPLTFNFQVESVLSDSISFGRFESESLSWERRSSFSHNRYLEEVEKYSKPGSVNEKKAYFEAHFKKKGGLLGQNSAESHTIENDASEQVNEEANVEIINMENHNGHFDDSSDNPQNHGDHVVTEFEEMPKPGISSPDPKFENSSSSVGGSVYSDLNDANAEIKQDDIGESKFSTLVGDELEGEMKQNSNNNNIARSANTPSEAVESGHKTEPVKKAGKIGSGSQQTHSPKMISKRETKAASKSLASIRQSQRNISSNVLKSPSNKSRGHSHSTCSEEHSSKTATSRTNAVRRTPKVEDSKVLKGKAILESRSGEKVKTSGASYSSPSKLESRSYLKTTTRQNRTVNSAMQDTGKSASASNFRSTDLAERKKQGKADAEIKKLQKNLDIRSKPIPSYYGAVQLQLDAKKALCSGAKVRNTLRKSTTMTAGSSSHSQLGKDINSASEAHNTSKKMSCHASVHVQATENSSIPSANQECLSEAASETENKRKKDQAKEKQLNEPRSRVSESCRTSKQGVEGRQKVSARRSMNTMGRRDIKGVAGSGMGRFAVGVTS